MRREWRRTSSSQAEPSPWRHCWTSWASCSKLPQPHLPDTCLGSTRRWVFRPANEWNEKCTGNVPRARAAPTDRLAGILTSPARSYNAFRHNLLELNCLPALDGVPARPVLCLRMTAKSRKAILAGLGILVAGYLVYHFRGSLSLSQFRWEQVWHAVRNANFFYLFLSVVAIYTCYAVRAVRWKRFQAHIGPAHFWNIYNMNLA